MKHLATSLIALALLAPLAAAGGLQKSRVPAGARWVVHLDVEALKSSKLYEAVHQASAKDGTNEMDEGLAKIRVVAGLDPTIDFKSVTLYCSAQSPESCVALLSGNEKIDQAFEKLRAMETYHTTPVENRALHTWGDGHETWYAYVQRKDGSDERVVLASQDASELVRGIAVLEGSGENLASAGSPAIRATPASGSILFAAAGESLSELGDVHPVSAIAKLAKAVVIDIGEDRGALRARVALDTRTPEDAQRIHQVLQGAVALVGLVGAEHEEAAAKLQRLADGLRLSVSDRRVDAEFRYDVQSLMEDLKSLEDLHDGDSDQDSRAEKRHHARKHHTKDAEEDK